MSKLKQKWDRILEHSLALATILTLAIAGIALVVVVGIAIALTKFTEFIK